ncbi:hypothetical protein FACS1894124_0720 [Spirochaetia bacterium]|nr:hypothetical protein FACS1894124_0720 [Spirochaetia bacterium]
MTQVELKIIADIASAKAGIVELGKSFDVLYKETKQYENELDKIEALVKAGIITEKEAAAQKQAADKKNLEALKDQYAEQVKLNGAQSDQAKAIKKSIDGMQNLDKAVPKKGLFSGLTSGVKEFGAEGEKAGKNLVKSLGPIALIAGVITAIVSKIKGMVESNAEASAAFEKMGDIIETIVRPPLEFIVGLLTKAAEGVSWLMSKIKGEATAATVEQNKLNDAVNKTAIASRDAGKTYQDSIDKTNTLLAAGLVKEQEAKELRSSAAAAYKAALEDQYAAQVKLNGAQSEQSLALAEQIKLLQQQIIPVKEGTAELTTQEKITKARTEAIQKQAASEKAARDANAAGLTTESEMTDAILKSNETLYSDLENIVNEYKLTTGETIRLRDATAEVVKEQRALTPLQQLSLELTEAEAAYREKEAAAQLKLNAGVLTQKEYEEQIKAAAEAHNNIVQGLAGKYAVVEGSADALAGSLKNVEKEAKKAVSALDVLGEANKVAGAATDLANQLISSKADAQKEEIQKELDDITKIIDDTLETEQERIDEFYEEAHKRMDEERNAALEAAGFIATTSEEGLQASMEAALASMDADIIYAEQRRQEELAINKKYDEDLLALQKNTDKEKEAEADIAAAAKE